MADDVLIRLATSEDARNETLKRSLLRLINESHRSAMAGLVVDPARFVRLDMEELTERLDGIVRCRMRRYLVLLFVEGDVRGCCSVTVGWHGDPALGHFGLLTVDEKWQRRGYATRLAAFAEEYCRRAGVRCMQCEELTCADKDEHPASLWLEKFYSEKLNFNVVEVYRCMKGEHQRGATLKHHCHFLVYRKILHQHEYDAETSSSADAKSVSTEDDAVNCNDINVHDRADPVREQTLKPTSH